MHHDRHDHAHPHVHGDAHKKKAEKFRARQWRREKWRAGDALLDAAAMKIERHDGREYDGAKFKLIKGGWKHDHCGICGADIYESPNPARGDAYTDGVQWVCAACHDKYLAT